MKMRDRFLSIFDNVVANIIVYLLFIAVPIVVGVLFNLGLQTTLLILLLIGQVFVTLLLFSVRNAISRTTKENKPLVRNADTNQVYLMDRYGLPHPIREDDTVLYFADMLGYQLDEIPNIGSNLLRPVGTEVTPYRSWHPPRTIEDEMSAEARRSLKLIRKYLRTEDGSKIISFRIRNDSDHGIQINTAKLTFGVDAPISVGDISPKNKPMVAGLLACKLLFDGTSESKLVSPQEECQADLFLTKNLTSTAGDALISVRLGYVQIKGFYQEKQIEFHLYV